MPKEKGLTSETPLNETPSPSSESLSTSIAEQLRTARESQNKTIDEVAESLRISKFRLRQLEDSSAPLLCDIYTRGFIRSYANHLGIESEELVQKHETLCQIKHKNRSFEPAPLRMTKNNTPRWGALSVSALLLSSLLAVVIFTYTHEESSPLVVADATSSPMNVIGELLSKETSSQPEVTAATPIPVSYHLKSNEPVWVEVKTVEGQPLTNHVMQVGDTYTLPVDQSVMISTDNLGALQLTSGEGDPHVLGAKGEKAHHYTLSPDMLKNSSMETTTEIAPQPNLSNVSENSLAETPQNQ